MSDLFYGVTDDVLAGLSEEGREYVLQHIGNENSGRYPRGSGAKYMQRPKTELDLFIIQKKELKSKGYSDTDIARKLGMTTTEYRDKTTQANYEFNQRLYREVQSRLARGETRKALAEEYGVSMSKINLYATSEATVVNKKKNAEHVATVLKDKVEQVKYLDISEGVEHQLGIPDTALRRSVRMLTDSGEYTVNIVSLPYLTDQKRSRNIKVLSKAGVTVREVWENKDQIRPVDFYFDDGNAKSLQNIQRPKSVSWDRVQIRYAIPAGEKGHGTPDDGATMDGAMFIRPGVKDLNMGKSKYAQVRIAVNDTHYLKGMALYGDEKDFPPGVDIIFNTNKTSKSPKEKVLKPIKEGGIDGPDPFGATIKRQAYMLGDDGKPIVNKKLTKLSKELGNKGDVYENGAINIVNEEGDWSSWSKTLSSQFLSKQPTKVVHEQLQKTLKKVDEDYQEILKIEQPTIRKILLENYSKELESKQVHLKAVAPKGFQAHTILPVPTMKENEVYAPNYKDGDRVILVRYPHAGRFEIPELVVNNKGPGKKMIGQSSDAIGIHPSVASKLSGADFDGDTAYVIPNNSGKFKTAKMLAGLKDFDTHDYGGEPDIIDGKEVYPYDIISKKTKQIEMGKASNLITDMTLRGGYTEDEMTRAVKHSMVIIDAEKHKLDWKRSERENGIKSLRTKYMGHIDNVNYAALERYNPDTRKVEKVIDPKELRNTGRYTEGARTVISRRKGDVTTRGTVVEGLSKTGKPRTFIRNAGQSYITTMMKDASEYLDDNSSPVEREYVDFINSLKAKKKTVDDELSKVPTQKQLADMKVIYKPEIESLKEKVHLSKLQAPKERQAQLLGTKMADETIELRGGKDALDNDTLKKIRNQALKGAREKVGAKRVPIEVTDEEWDAINANALSASMIREITRYMNDDELKALAMPRTNVVISDNKKSKIKTLSNNGYTMSEIASIVGVSTSSIAKVIKE